MTTKLPAVPNQNLPPPVLAGNVTGAVRRRVEDLLFSLASCFEIWVTRRQSLRILATIKVVHAFRDDLVTRDAAPKTLNRRISSVSSFYKHLGAAAGELRLPITVPNPAHAQFIARQSTSPGREQGPLGNPGAPGHGHCPLSSSVRDCVSGCSQSREQRLSAAHRSNKLISLVSTYPPAYSAYPLAHDRRDLTPAFPQLSGNGSYMEPRGDKRCTVVVAGFPSFSRLQVPRYPRRISGQ